MGRCIWPPRPGFHPLLLLHSWLSFSYAPVSFQLRACTSPLCPSRPPATHPPPTGSLTCRCTPALMRCWQPSAKTLKSPTRRRRRRPPRPGRHCPVCRTAWRPGRALRRLPAPFTRAASSSSSSRQGTGMAATGSSSSRRCRRRSMAAGLGSSRVVTATSSSKAQAGTQPSKLTRRSRSRRRRSRAGVGSMEVAAADEP